MVKLECISHFAAAVVTDPTNTRVCIGLLSAARPYGAVPSKYLPSDDGSLPVMCEYRNFECAFCLCLPFCISDHVCVRNYTVHRYVVCSM